MTDIKSRVAETQRHWFQLVESTHATRQQIEDAKAMMRAEMVRDYNAELVVLLRNYATTGSRQFLDDARHLMATEGVEFPGRPSQAWALRVIDQLTDSVPVIV